MVLSMKVVSLSDELIVEVPLGVNSGFDFSFLFLFDFYSVIFLSFVILISSVVIIYMRFYMFGDCNEVRFSILVLLFIMSMGILIMRPSLLRIIVG